jgi:hypothetical protein
MTIQRSTSNLNAGLFALRLLRAQSSRSSANAAWFARDQETMNKHPRKAGHNVVKMPSKPLESRSPARDFAGNAAAPGPLAVAGSPDDPRTQEALRLIEAFLAIEDATARAALITLAQRLVSYDWVRDAQQR